MPLTATPRSRRWTLLLCSAALAAGLAACDKSAESSSADAAASDADVAAKELSAAVAEARAPGSVPASAAGSAAGNVAGTANRHGSQLAYEHDVRIRVDGQKIAANLSSARDACMAQTYGECTVLGEDLVAGEAPRGELRMRAAPSAVAGLVGLAGAGGEIAQRSTRAEDLADAVRDNTLRRDRLQLQHRKLAEVLERRDLQPPDIYALTERMAQLEAEFNAASQEAATHERRIQTNLLTLRFESAGLIAVDSASRIGAALRGIGDSWDSSAAVMITVVATLLPWALFALLALWLARLAFRQHTRRPAPATAPWPSGDS
jgi:hypothetical protein